MMAEKEVSLVLNSATLGLNAPSDHYGVKPIRGILPEQVL